MTKSEELRERAEARALLWQIGQFELAEAVDVLQAWAVSSGLVKDIGQDAVQAILAQAFTAVRDDLPKTEPLRTYTTAQSTLDAAAWLWFQVGDEERFKRFLDGRPDAELAAIKKHIETIEAKRNAKNGR